MHVFDKKRPKIIIENKAIFLLEKKSLKIPLKLFGILRG